MWINKKLRTPEVQGTYTVFGTVAKGSPEEKECRFTACWLGEKYGWGDANGEDLTGINDGVKFWYDFTQVIDPSLEEYNNVARQEPSNEYQIALYKEKLSEMKVMTDEMSLLSFKSTHLLKLFNEKEFTPELKEHIMKEIDKAKDIKEVKVILNLFNGLETK